MLIFNILDLFHNFGGQMYIKNSYVCLPNMLIVYVV